MTNTDQMLPVIDPWSMKKIGEKRRSEIHHYGNWHVGVQAHIIRRNKVGTFDILIQKRSGNVDIGRDCYDQSLAVQLSIEDKLNTVLALKRGLHQELGISKFTYSKFLGFQLGIIKKYTYNPLLWNQERIVLYFILSDNQPKLVSEKVDDIFWMEWHNFLRFFELQRDSFTKTARFYFGFPLLRESISKQSSFFLGMRETTKNYSPKERFLLRVDDEERCETYDVNVRSQPPYLSLIHT